MVDRKRPKIDASAKNNEMIMKLIETNRTRVCVKLMVKVFQVFIIPPSTVFASHKGKLPPTTVIVTALPLPSTHHYLGTDV